MEFNDLKDEKRERDGVICVSDNCISYGKGADFETNGEFCSECECGFPPESVTLVNIEEINAIRIKYSQQKIKG